MELGRLQKEWIKSLREHPERQFTGGALAKRKKVKNTDDEYTYKACCLGELHLCHLRLEGEKPTWTHGDNLYDGETNHDGYLAISHEKYGLFTSEGRFKDGQKFVFTNILGGTTLASNLASANDNGVSWNDIADFIEANPEEVFTKSV